MCRESDDRLGRRVEERKQEKVESVNDEWKDRQIRKTEEIQ